MHVSNSESIPSERLIVFVLSFRHSGSTIVGQVLGASPDAVFVGESDRILHQVAAGARCSCGRLVEECFAVSSDGLPSPDRVRRSFLRLDPLRSPKHLWQIVTRSVGPLPRELQPIADAQCSAWATKFESSSVVVDSSKSLRLVAHHCREGHHQVRIVVVRRDPVSTINSSVRKAATRALSGRSRLRVLASAYAELARLVIAEAWMRRVAPRLGVPYCWLSFDNWSDDPASATLELTDACKIEPVPLDGRSVELPSAHVIEGNRRTSGGTVRIRNAERGDEAVRPPLPALARLLTRTVGNESGSPDWDGRPPS